MRINRHDAKLDALIGEMVKVEFTDGDVRDGILGWNERTQPPRIMHSQHYFIVQENGVTIEFRKGHVKSISKVEEGK